MSTDISCNGEQVGLCFDFLEVDERVDAVRTRIDVEYKGFRQTLRWTLDAVWFEYGPLRSFEKALQSEALITLHNMSDHPVLTLLRSSEGDELHLNPRASRLSSDGEALFVTLKTEAGFVDRLHAAFADYAKWW